MDESPIAAGEPTLAAESAEPPRKDRVSLAATPWWPLFVWLGLPLAIVNFSIAPLINLGVFGIEFAWVMELAPILTPLVFAQAVLASACLALGRQAFSGRLAIYGIAVTAGLLCWLVGYAVSVYAAAADGYSMQAYVNGKPVSTDVVSQLSLGLALPLIALGFQLPFWIVRISHGWRLIPARQWSLDAKSASPRETLSVANLLMATAVVAISFGLLKLTPGTEPNQDYTFTITALSGMAAIHTYCVAVPLTAIFFRSETLFRGWLWAFVFTVVATAALCGLQCLMFPVDMPLGEQYELLKIVALMSCTYSAVLSLGFTILRVYGWALFRKSMVASLPIASSAIESDHE